MEAALTDALNWLETGGGDVVSCFIFLCAEFLIFLCGVFLMWCVFFIFLCGVFFIFCVLCGVFFIHQHL